MDDETPRFGGLALLACGAAYALLSLVYFWPLPSEFATHMIGGPGDGPMFLWNLWWAPHAVALGQNPLATDLLFFPAGTSLALNTHHVLPSLLSAPLQEWFGLVSAYNAMLCLTGVLAGMGMALLLFELWPDRRAAFLAGVVFAFGHTRGSTLLFFNLAQTQFLVWYVWALLRAERRGGRGAALLAGVLAACLFASSYNLLVLAFLFSVGFVMHAVWRRRREGRPLGPLLAQAAWITASALVLSAPVSRELAVEVSDQGSYVSKLESKSYDESVPVRRLLVRGALDQQDAVTDRPLRQASYLGVVALLLALVGVVQWRRGSPGFWLVVALAFLLLSLGPRFNWDSDSLANVGQGPELPFAWMQQVPVLREVRTAHRYAIPAALALAVLAGLGAARLFAALSRRGAAVGNAALVGLTALVFLDFQDLPFHKLYRLPDVPPVIHAIGADARDVCVVAFPAGRQGWSGFTYYQTVHGRPLYLDGELARTPDALRDRRKDSPLLAELRRLARRPEAGTDVDTRTAMRAEIQQHRIGWVLLAWTDKSYLLGRDEGDVTLAGLQAQDRMVRECLDVEEVVLAADEEDYRRWQELPLEEGRSAVCLYRGYRLRLD